MRLYKFVNRKGWGLFHHDLFDQDLSASGEVQEVNSLFHAAAVDLMSAIGVAIGDHLAHAVVKHIAVLGFTFDIQGALHRVGEDADVALAFFDAPDFTNFQACRIGVAGSQVLGDDTILGSAGNDTLYGGEGNDSLSGGAGTDKLYGGDGEDIFVYNNGDGSDTIADYKEEDSIQIASGTVDNVSTASNGSVVFKVGKGKITVNNAKDKIVAYEDADGIQHYYPVNWQNMAKTPSTSRTMASIPIR